MADADKIKEPKKVEYKPSDTVHFVTDIQFNRELTEPEFEELKKQLNTTVTMATQFTADLVIVGQKSETK